MRRKMLVTGAGGYLAWELLHVLSDSRQWEIIAMTGNLEKTSSLYQNLQITFVTNEDVFERKFSLDGISHIIHTAFGRESRGEYLAESLEFTKELAVLASESRVKVFINISSQSVYGAENIELSKEDGKISPEYLYALAKCASEILLDGIGKFSETVFTNVRTASLIGPSYFVPKNVLYKFIQSALDGEEFCVVGGKQKFSFLDVRDAAAAIVMLAGLESWEKVYNLGPSSRTEILFMADVVCEKVQKFTGQKPGYQFIPDDIRLLAGLDSSMLYKVLDWKPRYGFSDTVEDTVKWILENERDSKIELECSNI